MNNKTWADMLDRYDDPLTNTGDARLNEMGRFVRQYVSSDPTSCVVRQGMMVEYIVTQILKYNGVKANDRELDLYKKLMMLRDKKCMSDKLYRSANNIRKCRNRAVHQFECDETISRDLMQPLTDICKWYSETNRKYKSKVSEPAPAYNSEQNPALEYWREAIREFRPSPASTEVLDRLEKLLED